MALTPGTRLGVYEVTAPIGAGGMGEVYRATDSNLKRSVAIKVLPASVTGDVDRLARFQREAEVLAALNHPNIAAIYGLEKTPDFTALVIGLGCAKGPTPSLLPQARSTYAEEFEFGVTASGVGTREDKARRVSSGHEWSRGAYSTGAA